MLRLAAVALALALTGLPAVAQEPIDHPTQTERVVINQAVDEQHPLYVEVIITACPPVEYKDHLTRCESGSAFQGLPTFMCPEPINQDTVPDQTTRTHDERVAWFHEIGCVDVPIPLENLTREMSVDECIAGAGVTAGIEFLKKRADLHDRQMVGQVACMVSDHAFEGVASQ